MYTGFKCTESDDAARSNSASGSCAHGDGGNKDGAAAVGCVSGAFEQKAEHGEFACFQHGSLPSVMLIRVMQNTRSQFKAWQADQDARGRLQAEPCDASPLLCPQETSGAQNMFAVSLHMYSRPQRLWALAWMGGHLGMSATAGEAVLCNTLRQTAPPACMRHHHMHAAPRRRSQHVLLIRMAHTSTLPGGFSEGRSSSQARGGHRPPDPQPGLATQREGAHACGIT